MVKNLAELEQVLGISFLQIGASLKKAHGFERECVTSVCETIYIAFSCLDFLHRQLRPNRSFMLKFGIIPGSFGLLYINSFARYLMHIIQI